MYQFGRGLDVLTIEIEAVNVAALEKLEQEGEDLSKTGCYKDH